MEQQKFDMIRVPVAEFKEAMNACSGPECRMVVPIETPGNVWGLDRLVTYDMRESAGAYRRIGDAHVEISGFVTGSPFAVWLSALTADIRQAVDAHKERMGDAAWELYKRTKDASKEAICAAVSAILLSSDTPGEPCTPGQA